MQRLTAAHVSPLARLCVSSGSTVRVNRTTTFAQRTACRWPSGLPTAGVRLASSFSPTPSPSTATQAASTKPSTGSDGPTPAGLQFPPRLLIYHAGTWRIVWVACWKLATIAVLAFTSLVVAPTLYTAPEINFPLPWDPPAEAEPVSSDSATQEPSSSFINSRTGRTMLAVAITFGGCIPVYYALLTTRPFVAYVHIALPLAARRSRPALRAWSARIPAAARVDVTSLRGFGNARQTATVVAELAEVPAVSPWRRQVPVTSSAPSSSASSRAMPTPTATLATPALSRVRRTTHGATSVTSYPDTEIEMTRRRLPGWLPPDPAKRSRWRLPEMRRFLVTAGRNRAGEDGSAAAEVWEAFLRRLNQPDLPVPIPNAKLAGKK